MGNISSFEALQAHVTEIATNAPKNAAEVVQSVVAEKLLKEATQEQIRNLAGSIEKGLAVLRTATMNPSTKNEIMGKMQALQRVIEQKKVGQIRELGGRAAESFEQSYDAAVNATKIAAEAGIKIGTAALGIGADVTKATVVGAGREVVSAPGLIRKYSTDKNVSNVEKGVVAGVGALTIGALIWKGRKYLNTSTSTWSKIGRGLILTAITGGLFWIGNAFVRNRLNIDEKNEANADKRVQTAMQINELGEQQTNSQSGIRFVTNQAEAASLGINNTDLSGINRPMYVGEVGGQSRFFTCEKQNDNVVKIRITTNKSSPPLVTTVEDIHTDENGKVVITKDGRQITWTREEFAKMILDAKSGAIVRRKGFQESRLYGTGVVDGITGMKTSGIDFEHQYTWEPETPVIPLRAAA